MTIADTDTTQSWAERARRVLPGGVNSPVRAFTAVGGEALQVLAGSGPRLRTVDGQELYDLCGSWGPLILGHSHPVVVEAIARAARDGTTFGLTTPAEVELAETLCRLVPDLEQVRLVNSGTEATMTALRLARGVTGRDAILKFAGGYHGHSDQLLVQAGSGLLTGGIASSAGVTSACAADTMVASYNDLDAVSDIIAGHGDHLAAIIVEPVAGNMGLVLPQPGFLAGLRELCDRCGALLIFDEVITGFRLACTTYGSTVGIRADLICLGKIIGGGLPIGAVGGARRHLRHLAPEGPVYQAGTLSGNPVAVAAGRATLDLLEQDPPYDRLDRVARGLTETLTKVAAERGIPFTCAHLGGMFTPFFTVGPVCDLAGATTSDTARYATFFHAARAAGVYLPPSQFEVAFVNAALSDLDAAAVTAGLVTALKGISESPSRRRAPSSLASSALAEPRNSSAIPSVPPP